MKLLVLAAEGTGAIAAVVALAIAIYAFGSFLMMRPYATARRFGVSMRELFREVLFAALTQPLLPLFYFFGRHLGGPKRAGAVPVVFVHGYMHNRVGFIGLARALARKGIGPLFGFNYPWYASLTSNARRLERFVNRVCEETQSVMVDLVCHSMGGLVAMEMMRSEAKRDVLKVRRIVTIATPHAGITWRGPILGVGSASLRRGSKLLEAHAGYKLTVPTLSIYSSHDNIVYPKATSSIVARGGRDLEIEGVAHLSILFSRAVAESVATFLSESSPAAAPSAAPPAPAVASGPEA